MRVDLEYLLQKIYDLLIVGIEQLFEGFMLFDIHAFYDLIGSLTLQVGKILHSWFPSELKYLF